MFGVRKTARLLPVGRVSTSKGEFLIDAGALRSILSENVKRPRRLPINIEHGAVDAGTYRQRVTPSGVFMTDIRLTPAGYAHVAGGGKLYLSPEIDFDPATRRVTRVKGAAITSTPSIDSPPVIGEYTAMDQVTKDAIMAQIVALFADASGFEFDEAASVVKFKAGGADHAYSYSKSAENELELAPVADMASAAVLSEAKLSEALTALEARFEAKLNELRKELKPAPVAPKVVIKGAQSRVALSETAGETAFNLNEALARHSASINQRVYGK